MSPPLLDGERARERENIAESTSPSATDAVRQSPCTGRTSRYSRRTTSCCSSAGTPPTTTSTERRFVCLRSHYVVRTTHGLDSRRSTGFPVLSAVTWPISHRSDYLLLPWIRWIYRLIGWRAFRTHKRFASANKLASIMSRCR